jgi:hypothetical protein
MHAVFECIADRISRQLTGLDSEETQSRPGGKNHSQTIQEIIEDLAHSYRVTAEILEDRLSKGRPSRSNGRTWLQWTLQLMILSFGHIPESSEFPDRKGSAPERRSPMGGSDLFHLLWRELDALDARLDECRHRFGMEKVGIHFLLGPLRVDQWRRFHAVHSIYCLEQLQFVRQYPQLATSSPDAVLAKELKIPVHRSVT